MSATDHGIMKISQDICTQLFKIRDMSIVCGSYDNGMSDVKIESVDSNRSKNLKELRNLTAIYVRFVYFVVEFLLFVSSCEEITDQRLRAIGNAIATNLNHLKKLHMGFQGLAKLRN